MLESGWPETRGLYRCEVDGKEQVLVHHYCGDTRRHWWTDTSGYDVISPVRFDPEPIAKQNR